MTLSLLQHLRETQGASLVRDTAQQFGLAQERATGFINAGLALVVGRLVNINQTQGTNAVLAILEHRDATALWRDIDFSHAHQELIELGGLDNPTSLNAVNLIAERSLGAIDELEQQASLGKEGLNELLDGQNEFLQGQFPDWIYAAAGLPALIGQHAYNTVKESVASLGSILRQASSAVAETTADVAHKTADTASTVIAETVSAAGSVAEGAGHLASQAAHKTADLASSAANSIGQATSEITRAPTSSLLRFLPWLGLIVVIALVLLYWFGIGRQTQAPAPATTPATTTSAASAPATAAPETLSFDVGANGELLSCHGTVGDSALQSGFMSAIQAQFGPAAQCLIVIDAKLSHSFVGLNNLGEALGAVKTTPNSSFAIAGDKISITTPNEAATKSLSERLRTLLGTSVAITSDADQPTKTTNTGTTAAAA